MSLLTTLAYAITAAVRPRVRDAEVAALQAKVDDLRRQLPRVERQRDDWQALAMRYRDELHAGPPPQRHFIDEQMRQQIQRRMLGAQAALQPYQMMQQHQNAQAHQLSMQNGPYIGQQLGQHLDEYIRNCTPGRHELLTRG